MTREIEYTLPTWLVVYYINGDATALTDDEIEKANQWYESNIKNGALSVDNNEAFFSYFNDFDKLGSDCYDCIVTYF